MDNKKKRIISISVISAVIVLLIYGFTEITYAINYPAVSVYIGSDSLQGEAMFVEKGETGEDLWLPGKTKKGTLRVYNNFNKEIKINGLGITMKLEKSKKNGDYETVQDKKLIELFAGAMKLTVKKGRFMVFSDTIYDKDFKEMIETGFNIPESDQVRIDSGNHADLEYTVYVDKNAGNDLQGLKATVTFNIRAIEN